MKPPRRFKKEKELTVDEQLAVIQAERRGEPKPRFETLGYREYRTDVLAEAGLDDEADEQEPGDRDDMTPDEHYRDLKRSNQA